MNELENRVKGIVNSLGHYRTSEPVSVEEIWFSEGNYNLPELFSREEREWKKFGVWETWGGPDQHFWFYTNITIPEHYQDDTVMLTLKTGCTDIWNTDNPQVLVYVNGELAATMDMNHAQMILCEKAISGEVYEVAFYVYSNYSEHTNFFTLTLEKFHKEVSALYYDLKVPMEAALLLRQDDEVREETTGLLNECINYLDLRKPYSQQFFDSIKRADQFIKSRLYSAERLKEKPLCPATVYSVGHTHIDVAWKWPVKQTRQKVVRSFLTVLNLMDQYPEYKFMSSQPQLYQFVKEEAPQVYERIKERIKEGRWEVEGGMWLEADCNLASGESLIRHILYGKQFFKEEFGVENNEVLWLPDVFGYSVALPQILVKSGIRYFVTTKIGWNDTNKMPNDTMMWQGLDGSEILTYFITTTNYDTYPECNQNKNFSTTYNGMQNASQIMGTWQRYQNKSLSKAVLTCYGYGDGGGGTTPEMLEENRRLAYGLCRVPKTKQSFVKDFFHTFEENMDPKKMPKWCGELYLEFHRGVYTSMARNKKNNRHCEFLLGDAEFLSIFATEIGCGLVYPNKKLEDAWKLLLLNQFHDILPGSSIKEVYEDSDIDYKKIKQLGNQMILEAIESILPMEEALVLGSQKIAVFNTLGFERTGIIHVPMEDDSLEQKIYLARNIPSKGYKMIDMKVEQGDNVILGQEKDKQTTLIETPYYLIRFNKQGEIESLYDKENQREVIEYGKEGNRLVAYEDRPFEYDSWNIDAYYEEKSWVIEDLEEFKVIENTPIRATIFLKRRFQESTIEQMIYLYAHTRRIDFKTRIDWKEHQILLKVLFPVNVLSSKATYDVQFGNIERPTHMNTSWDTAKFEVCAHKWADLSEYGYGVAILNDCKYGYDIHGSLMRLTLIKSGIFPNPDADIEGHEFTYSCYPHLGDFRKGKVVQEAYDLNCPMYAKPISAINVQEESVSYLSCENENIMIDTIKAAEGKAGIIIRLYETYGDRRKIRVKVPTAKGRHVYECDCMENIIMPIVLEEDYICMEIKPYEIKTILIC